MAKDFFRDIGTAIFKPVGDFISGGVTALQPGRVQQMQLERKKMQALLDSEAGRTLMNKARAAAMDRGEGYYGGRGVDPWVKGSEDLGKIRSARDKFSEEEMTPETATYFDAAEKSVLDRMNRGKKAEDGSDFVGPPAPRRTGKAGDFIGPPAPRRARDFIGPPAPTRTDNAEYFQPRDAGKAARAGLEMVAGLEDMNKVGRAFSDYFQTPTETVPEGNIPKTYPQLGIESIDDMAVLDEMQKALPDVDMRQEYESDPEMMKKLMELWRQKKLKKQNLHKAFSKIQQTAQQALGIA